MKKSLLLLCCLFSFCVMAKEASPDKKGETSDKVSSYLQPPVLIGKKEKLKVGRYSLMIEVMKKDDDRMRGMMHRTAMGKNEGMLFVFPVQARYCMWMKNTKIPLSVAFLDEKGKIINIEDMKPETETSHCAKRAVRYALEVPRGWFKRHGIKPGFVIPGVLSYQADDKR